MYTILLYILKLLQIYFSFKSLVYIILYPIILYILNILVKVVKRQSKNTSIGTFIVYIFSVLYFVCFSLECVSCSFIFS